MTKQPVLIAAFLAVGVTGYLIAQPSSPTMEPAKTQGRYDAQVLIDPMGSATMAITDHVTNKHYIYAAEGNKLVLKIVTDLSRAGEETLENMRKPTTKPADAR